MANKHVKLEGSVFTYTAAEGHSATLDLDKVPGLDFGAIGEVGQQMIVFALSHLSRNATAGKMEKPDEAIKPVQTRFAALLEGKFRAHREGGEGGESESSQLSRALAIVMGVEPADAAAFILSQVNDTLEENGIDPDADAETMTAEEKSKKRKIAASVRKQIGDDPAVSIEVQKIRLADAQAKLATAEKESAGKESKFKAAAAPAAE